MTLLASASYKTVPPYHNCRGNKMIDNGLKSSMFIKGDVLLTSGSCPHFAAPAFSKNNTRYFRSKASVFFKVDVLLLSGRSTSGLHLSAGYEKSIEYFKLKAAALAVLSFGCSLR